MILFSLEIELPYCKYACEQKGGREGDGNGCLGQAGGIFSMSMAAQTVCQTTAGAEATKMVCKEQKVPSRNILNTIKILKS